MPELEQERDTERVARMRAEVEAGHFRAVHEEVSGESARALTGTLQFAGPEVQKTISTGLAG